MKPLTPRDPRKIGAYSLVSRLGSGGMGDVFVATKDGENVALKVIRDAFVEEPSFVARFQREIAILKSVSHPNVIGFIDSGIDDGRVWYASELAAGPDLQKAIQTNGPLKGEAWWNLAAGLIGGLSAIHEQNTVHRDVKPSNIIMSPFGPKIIDLGIAKGEDETSFTQTGIAPGTPAWFSPEHIDAEDVTAASDFFATGIILCYAGSGQTPWGPPASLNFHNIVQRLSQPPNLSGLNDDQREFVSGLLDSEPDRRLEHVAKITSPNTIDAIPHRTNEYQFSSWNKDQHTSSEDVPRPGVSNKRQKTLRTHRKRLRNATLVLGGTTALAGIAWIAPLQSVVENRVAEQVTHDIATAFLDGDIGVLRDLYRLTGQDTLSDTSYAAAISDLRSPARVETDRNALAPGQETGLWGTASISFGDGDFRVPVELELTEWRRFLWLHVPVFRDSLTAPVLSISQDTPLSDAFDLVPLINGSPASLGSYRVIPGNYLIAVDGSGLASSADNTVQAGLGFQKITLVPTLRLTDAGESALQATVDEKIQSCSKLGQKDVPACFEEMLETTTPQSLDGPAPLNYFSLAKDGMNFVGVDCEPTTTKFLSAKSATVSQKCAWTFQQNRVYYGATQVDRWPQKFTRLQCDYRGRNCWYQDYEPGWCESRSQAPVCEWSVESVTVRGAELFRGDFEFKFERAIEVSVAIDGQGREVISNPELVSP